MRKTAVVAVLVGSLCLFSCSKKSSPSNSSRSSSTESPPIGAASPGAPTPTFTVCSGTYALCTMAQCAPIAGSKLVCGCDVKQGYSAGSKSCGEVPPDAPYEGQSIPSRYYPIKSMAVCPNSLPWASCLDAPCTVDADLSKAKCSCGQVATPTQSYVVVTDSYSASTCTSGIIWSSATVQDVLQITGFLQDSQQLKPFPITIVGVGPAKGVAFLPQSSSAPPGTQ